MKNIKKGLLLVGLLAIGWAAWWCGMNYTGYCHAEGRYLSDEDFIQAAILGNISDMNIDGSEESIRNFHTKNPTCCSVDRNSQMASSTLESLLGFYYVVVEINYDIKKDNYNKLQTKKFDFYRRYIEVTSCGNMGSTYGEQTEKLNTAVKL